MSTFRNDYNGFSFSDAPVLLNPVRRRRNWREYRDETHATGGFTYLLLPFASLRRPLRNKDEVRSSPNVMKPSVILKMQRPP